MKNTIILLLYITMVCFSINCNAQPPQDGENRLNNNINKFIGTWNWSSGNQSLQLIFKKENIKNPYMNIDFRYDTLLGFHKLINNGTIIENSTQFSNTVYSDKNWTILANTYNNDPNKLNGTIRHFSKNKSVKFKIDYIDSTHIKLVKITNTDGMKIIVPGQPAYDSSISLPQNIILTKQ